MYLKFITYVDYNSGKLLNKPIYVESSGFLQDFFDINRNVEVFVKTSRHRSKGSFYYSGNATININIEDKNNSETVIHETIHYFQDIGILPSVAPWLARATGLTFILMQSYIKGIIAFENSYDIETDFFRIGYEYYYKVQEKQTKFINLEKLVGEYFEYDWRRRRSPLFDTMMKYIMDTRYCEINEEDLFEAEQKNDLHKEMEIVQRENYIAGAFIGGITKGILENTGNNIYVVKMFFQKLLAEKPLEDAVWRIITR